MEDILNLLSVDTVHRKLKKGALLITQGEVPSAVYIVVSGCVVKYRYGRAGEKHIAGFKMAGDLFPEPWAFGYVSHTIYNYEALEDSELAVVSQEIFQSTVASSDALQKASFRYIMKNYMGAVLQTTALGQLYAIDKLAMMLHYLVLRYGIEKAPGEFWLKIKLSHVMIASLTGLTRETVTTSLNRLRRKGLIEYDHGTFMVRLQALIQEFGDGGLSEKWL